MEISWQATVFVSHVYHNYVHVEESSCMKNKYHKSDSSRNCISNVTCVFYCVILTLLVEPD